MRRTGDSSRGGRTEKLEWGVDSPLTERRSLRGPWTPGTRSLAGGGFEDWIQRPWEEQAHHLGGDGPCKRGIPSRWLNGGRG